MPIKDIIKVNNYAKKLDKSLYGYEGYEWRVFIDEDEATLDKIDYVEYLLHKTFPNPKRPAGTRAKNFELKSAGWGEFYIYINIFFKNGEKKEQRYWLSFDKQWPKE